MPRRRRPNAFVRSLQTLAAFAVLGLFAWWGWRQPQVQAAIEAYRLQRMPAPLELPVPVAGVRPGQLHDTWGASRSGGRSHEGIDIFAPRGTVVASSTRGVVMRVAEQGLGGRQVWVLGPGGERHYYAHLDDWAPGIARFERVQPGTPLGTVGDTGNARGTPPHLHYGIYGGDGATNPYPRLRPAER